MRQIPQLDELQDLDPISVAKFAEALKQARQLHLHPDPAIDAFLHLLMLVGTAAMSGGSLKMLRTMYLDEKFRRERRKNQLRKSEEEKPTDES